MLSPFGSTDWSFTADGLVRFWGAPRRPLCLAVLRDRCSLHPSRRCQVWGRLTPRDRPWNGTAETEEPLCCFYSAPVARQIVSQTLHRTRSDSVTGGAPPRDIRSLSLSRRPRGVGGGVEWSLKLDKGPPTPYGRLQRLRHIHRLQRPPTATRPRVVCLLFCSFSHVRRCLGG